NGYRSLVEVLNRLLLRPADPEFDYRDQPTDRHLRSACHLRDDLLYRTRQLLLREHTCGCGVTTALAQSISAARHHWFRTVLPRLCHLGRLGLPSHRLLGSGDDCGADLDLALTWSFRNYRRDEASR